MIPGRSDTPLSFDTSPAALTRSHPVVRRVARLLTYSVVATLVFLFLAPWRQSVRGEGRVIAYAPTERQQTLEAPIKGRITRWYVQEGSTVKAGDKIVDLSDNDPLISERLADQRDAARARVSSTNLAVAVGESRVSSMKSARDAAVSTAELAVSIARDNEDAAEQALRAADIAYDTAKLNYDRMKSLESEQLASRRDYELARLKLIEAKSKRDAAKAKLRAAKRKVSSASAKLSNVRGKEAAEVNKAEAALQKLKQEKAKADADLSKAKIDLSRQQSMSVVAPRDGTVLRLLANGEGHWVKPGDPIAILVPSTESRAVELWVNGNDAPLVTPGREVRMQFEGWPAVQFTGWPSVAVGTFEGRVALVDAADDGNGRFRVVVVPASSEEWPEARYLRQGVRANGWVLLNEVTVGYELWRQLNGFPPAVAPPKDANTGRPLEKEKVK